MWWLYCSRHFSSQNILVKPHCPSLLSVCAVCVCIFRLVMLEPLSVSFLFCFGGITFSISVYIMCVCLFSALSRRVGALHIAMIIVIYVAIQVMVEGRRGIDERLTSVCSGFG